MIIAGLVSRVCMAGLVFRVCVGVQIFWGSKYHVTVHVVHVHACYIHDALYIFVGSCLATKVFIGNLPGMGRDWVIIK